MIGRQGARYVASCTRTEGRYPRTDRGSCNRAPEGRFKKEIVKDIPLIAAELSFNKTQALFVLHAGLKFSQWLSITDAWRFGHRATEMALA